MEKNENSNHDENVEVRINPGVCNPHTVTADVPKSWYEKNRDICHLTNDQRKKDKESGK